MPSAPTRPQAPWHRRLLYGLTNWALLVAGLANLGVGTLAALDGGATVAATSLTAGLVLLLAATIDRFESLKGLGVEAKTRQLDQKLNEADEALQRVKEVTELAAAALIDLNSKMGRWDAKPTPRESIALAHRLRQMLAALGSDERAVIEALKPWAHTLCLDLAVALLEPLGQAVQQRLQALEREKADLSATQGAQSAAAMRLGEDIQAGTRFIQQRLLQVHQFDLRDFPSRWLGLFDQVPLVDAAEVERLRTQAADFADDMTLLREQMQLAHPERWIAVIDAARPR